MAKASLKLRNGTTVQIEGTPEEVQKLLEFYAGQPGETGRKSSVTKKRPEIKITEKRSDAASLNLAEIVNFVKNCEEAEAIEKQVLDRFSQVDRALLPLYIVHEYMGGAFGLTSGQISKITTDLGIPIAQPNASRTLSGTASRYVMGDKMKKKGQAVRYKLSRRGVKYLKAVLEGAQGGE